MQQRQTWVCMRVDRGVHIDSLCNGGEGNLLDRSSSAAACTSPSVHPSPHRSAFIACPVNLPQALFLFHLPSIAHHRSCLMFLLLHSSLLPPLLSSGPHPSGLMIKLLPGSSEAQLHISQSWVQAVAEWQPSMLEHALAAMETDVKFLLPGIRSAQPNLDRDQCSHVK